MSPPASIWLVGAGNMGGAMLRRWVGSGIDPASIVAIDPGVPPVPEGVRLVDAPPPGGTPDVLILATKPQLLDAVTPGLAQVRPRVLISILAGVEAAIFSRRIPSGAIVRAMPNLPVSIGKGVVALHATHADAAARETTETLMAPLGLVEWIDNEAAFHAIVALSGSGPGFVYRFIEALAAGGVALGLPTDQAQRFAIATVEGAAALAAGSVETPAMLANRVASPGGTTRAGLDILDDGDAMLRLVRSTLDAAARRSAEMAEAARG